jgi:dihydrofolate synthase/folylpolyglutamate synthase
MTNYQETIKYLFNLQYTGIKLGLKNITNLLSYLGNPQDKWPAIHIAGTNGKGSTAIFLFYILRSYGYKTGLYTSPHLIDFSERIRVNEKNISWQNIVDYISDLKPQIQKHKSTFFEATTAIAFQYFCDQKIDIGIIETGLGGRLDATNLVHPLITIITPISKDHTQFLGNNLRQIAKEKAGIIKKNIPCISNNEDKRILKIIQEICSDVKAPFFNFPEKKSIDIIKSTIEGSLFNLNLPEKQLRKLEISMAGTHQIQNAALAVAAIQKTPHLKINISNIHSGLFKAYWPARMQVIKKSPLTILDVAHNSAGFTEIFKFIHQQFPNKKIWVLVGLIDDKDYKSIGKILEKYSFKIGVITKFSEKALLPKKLIDNINNPSIDTFIFNNILDGYLKFSEQISLKDLLLIIGSHYLAGDFLKKIQKS